MIKIRCQKKVDEICKKYDITSTKVVFSNRLKNANGTYQYTYNTNNLKKAKTPLDIAFAIESHKITISNHILTHFDEERVMCTLMHEVAHHIRVMTAKDIAHSYEFKKLCAELGGTMNSKLAGSTFKSTASKDFVSTRIGVIYECKCGLHGHGRMHYVNSPRQSSLDRFSCPQCGSYMKTWNRKENK